MPAVDAPVTWALQSTFAGAAQPQAVIVQPVGNTLSGTGLFTANKAGTNTIIATTNQNIIASVAVNIAALAAQVK